MEHEHCILIASLGNATVTFCVADNGIFTGDALSDLPSSAVDSMFGFIPATLALAFRASHPHCSISTTRSRNSKDILLLRRKKILFPRAYCQRNEVEFHKRL